MTPDQDVAMKFIHQENTSSAQFFRKGGRKERRNERMREKDKMSEKKESARSDSESQKRIEAEKITVTRALHAMSRQKS